MAPYPALLLLVPFLAAPPAGSGKPPGMDEATLRAAIAADEAALKSAGIGSDGLSLLAYLRKRTLSPEVRLRAVKLLGQLGDDDYQVREKAGEDLLDMGPVVVPLLRPATRSADLEVRRRAERLQEQLERRLEPGHVAAVARLLAVRKPAGASAVLLAYLPDAPGETEAEETRAALAVVSCPGGKPDKVIVAGLSDTDPVRRAAAAEVVGRSGSAAHKKDVLKLLEDREPGVRLRAALGLALAREKKAVPVLIELTGQLPAEQRLLAEDALYRLAGEDGPTPPTGDAPAEGRKRREQWASWWEKNSDKVDMGRLTRDVTRGYTLAVVFEGGAVRVTELGRDGKPMWTIKGLNNAVDAYIVPGNRVLITELGAMRVTEQTFDGKVVWEYKLGDKGGWLSSGPILAQRLPNGNTFIVTFQGVLEVDCSGKQVLTRTGYNLRAGFKYRDGRIGLVTSGNEYIRLDTSGKVEKRFSINLAIGNTLGGIDFLPDGGLLVVRNDRVVQYTADGREVWQATGLTNAYCPTRLANGNTIVACTGTRQFIEFDRAGKVVRKLPVETGTPWVARRR